MNKTESFNEENPEHNSPYGNKGVSQWQDYNEFTDWESEEEYYYKRREEALKSNEY